MKKIWKKLLSVALAVCVCMPLAACGGGGNGDGDGDSGNKVVINLEFNRGGVQSAWFYDVEAAFEAATATKQFGDKVGIELKWNETTVNGFATAASSGVNIYMDEGNSDFVKQVGEGIYMDITDVVTSVNPYDGKTIASKLTGSTQTYMQNDKYYGLPWKEFYTGIGYNADMFTEKGFYFVDPAQAQVPWSGNGGYSGKQYYFSQHNPYAEKTAGLDGIKGTYDDGLPTTLEELMALCHIIKEAGSDWYPFACTGGIHEDYTNYLTKAILIGLEGEEKFGNYQDCDGTMEIVTGYTTEKLWGLDNVYVPITEEVQVKANDRSTWINISKSVNRYYAIAFMQYLVKNTMICPCIRSSASSNITVQGGFVFSNTYQSIGHHSAMIMEGSYWYTESEHNGTFSDWDNYMFGEDRPEFGIMPYVGAVDGSLSGVETVFASMCSNANVWINNNLNNDRENNKYVIEACKEFLYFFYSDEQILSYTEATGQIRAKTNYDWQSLVYEKDGNGNYKNGLNGTERVIKADCKIPNYQITVLELGRDANYVTQEPTTVNPTNIFKLGNTTPLMKPDLGVFYSVFKNGGMNVKQAFEASMVAG